MLPVGVPLEVSGHKGAKGHDFELMCFNVSEHLLHQIRANASAFQVGMNLGMGQRQRVVIYLFKNYHRQFTVGVEFKTVFILI